MKGADPTILNYIRNASDDRRVRDDLGRMYDNYRSEGSPLFDDRTLRRMGDRGHAEEVSRAMQRMERMAGNDGNFRVQGLFDMAQQEYDGEARQIHTNYRSADHDGQQDYWRNDGGNVAMAQRAAAHQPIDRFNASQASIFIQQREGQAVRQGDLWSARGIDRMQERFEGRTGIANTPMSRDFDGRSTIDHIRNAHMLFGWLNLMR